MDGCMRSVRGAGFRPRPTPPCAPPTSPRHQLPVPALGAVRRSAGRRGTGGGQSSGCTPATPTDRAGCSTPRPGSAGRRRWCWRSAAAPAPRRWRWRRPNRTSTWSPSRSTGAGLAQLLSGDRPRRRHQHPAGPRRRRRRARAHVGAGVADRRAGVLPRPVAQGAPPQAPAAATGDGRADRRPAAARRRAARRHRPRRVRRTDRRGRRRRTPAAPGAPKPTHCPSRCSRPVTKYETRPSTRAAPSPNCSGRRRP